MIFKGKITEVGEIRTGQTKNDEEWASLNFEVTESNPRNESYPQIGGFAFFKKGEYVKYAKDFETYYKIGDEVEVDFNLQTQEYDKKDGSGKAKFYKNSVFKLTKTEGVTEQAPQMEDNGEDKMPF